MTTNHNPFYLGGKLAGLVLAVGTLFYCLPCVKEAQKERRELYSQQGFTNEGHPISSVSSLDLLTYSPNKSERESIINYCKSPSNCCNAQNLGKQVQTGLGYQQGFSNNLPVFDCPADINIGEKK